jgi:hypothetical protein
MTAFGVLTSIVSGTVDERRGREVVDDDVDTVIPVSVDQISDPGDSIVLSFAPDELPDGVYQLESKSSDGTYIYVTKVVPKMSAKLVYMIYI